MGAGGLKRLPSAMPDDSTKLFAFLALFQFFHWFQPSSPYMTAFAMLTFNVSESTLLLDVYSWDVVFQVGSLGARKGRALRWAVLVVAHAEVGELTQSLSCVVLSP
jgi:hypothetical protein